MPQKIKNKQYYFISTYGSGLHVGGAIRYRGMNELDKLRKKEGNFFESEAEAQGVLKKIKKLLK